MARAKATEAAAAAAVEAAAQVAVEAAAAEAAALDAEIAAAEAEAAAEEAAEAGAAEAAAEAAVEAAIAAEASFTAAETADTVDSLAGVAAASEAPPPRFGAAGLRHPSWLWDEGPVAEPADLKSTRSYTDAHNNKYNERLARARRGSMSARGAPQPARGSARGAANRSGAPLSARLEVAGAAKARQMSALSEASFASPRDGSSVLPTDDSDTARINAAREAEAAAQQRAVDAAAARRAADAAARQAAEAAAARKAEEAAARKAAEAAAAAEAKAAEEAERKATLRCELEGLKMTEVAKRALQIGISEQRVDDALDADTPRSALIEMVLTETPRELPTPALSAWEEERTFPPGMAGSPVRSPGSARPQWFGGMLDRAMSSFFKSDDEDEANASQPTGTRGAGGGAGKGAAGKGAAAGPAAPPSALAWETPRDVRPAGDKSKGNTRQLYSSLD
mmetsp:Transcript_28098/g.82711  ORF Transcript_28098/g.82711 Transcript_28098/m.82711 type:complete len:452 (-) Transcript_28098:188-1543(-)